MAFLSKQTLLTAAVIVCGFAGIFVLSSFLDKHRPALPAGYEDEDLALQGAKLKNFSLGFEGLLADWYWMKSLQYIGDKVLNSTEDVSMENLKPLNPRLLYPYLDNATTLDPKFLAAYEYGAVVLPAIDNQQAIEFTHKAIENNPNEYKLYHYLGYIYWRSGQYEQAGEIYEQGSRIPNAPDIMRLMAAKMRTEGDSRATARAIYEQMYSESKDAQIKQIAALRLLELDSLDERDAIRKVLRDLQTKNKQCPESWREILLPLRNEKLSPGKDFQVDKVGNLIDPSGTAYVLDRENCDVKLDERKTKISLK